MRGYFFLIIFGLSPLLASPDTLNVPGDYQTINEAIQAANPGDTVLVAPGIYNENIDFLGKAITVKGSQGMYRTVLDGGNNGSGVSFVNGEGSDSILEGFKITNGSGTSNFLMRSTLGGGIYLEGASPTLRSLWIAENMADEGAGIFCSGGTLSLDHVAFEDNTAFLAGGGVYLNDGSGMFDSCVIKNNEATHLDGGGIYSANSILDISNSEIIGNECQYWGGGLLCFFGLGTVIENTIIASNTTQAVGGGAAFFFGETFSLINVTLSENSAVQGQGGGIYIKSIAPDPPPYLVNTILWNDSAPTGPEGALDGSNLAVDYCQVKNGSSSFHVISGNLSWGVGNKKFPPIFADKGTGDFHLLAASAGINSGDNSTPGLPETDFEGDPRINDNNVDMGADEFYLPYLYFTGVTKGAEVIQVKLIGKAFAYPVYIFMGSGVLENPIVTPNGDWYLAFPVYTFLFPPIPAGGYAAYPVKIPELTLGVPLPFQALVGNTLTPLALLSTM